MMLRILEEILEEPPQHVFLARISRRASFSACATTFVP
jgi:hypothetical protein